MLEKEREGGKKGKRTYDLRSFDELSWECP